MEAALEAIRQAIIRNDAEDKPTVVYIAIGCANSSTQQFPPFLKAIADEPILLLVDPCLEEVTFAGCCTVAVREEWDWSSVLLRAQLIGLFSISPYVSVIVQDFTGADINKYYPFQPPHPRLLFDVTYGVGGCGADMTAVRLLLDNNGGFEHPLLSPLRQIRDPTVLGREVLGRRDIVCKYLWPRLMVQEGQLEPAPWYDENYVLEQSWQLLRIYGNDEQTDNLYRTLLRRFWEDLAATARLTCAECPPDAAYRRTVNALCSRICQSSE